MALVVLPVGRQQQGLECVTKVKQLLDTDHGLSIRLISEELSLSYETVQITIAKILPLRKRCGSDEQNVNRLGISTALKKVENFL